MQTCEFRRFHAAEQLERAGTHGGNEWLESRCRINLVMAADKQHAHELIDRLAPSQVPKVIGMLEALLDPVSRAIANAPIDDEPLTAQDEKALGEAREWSRQNKGIPHEKVLAELGVTQEEVDQFRRTEVKRIVWT